MQLFILRLAIFISLASLVSTASGKELISKFQGSRSTTTAEFEARAPWILDWRVKGDYPGSMAVQITLESSPGGEHLGKVTTTKWVTDGVRLFSQSGRFRFVVDSSLAEWTLIVEQLNREEAEAYTSKGVD